MQHIAGLKHNSVVTFAKLLLEIRRRAAAMADDGRPRAPLDQIVREALDLEPAGPRRDLITQLLYEIARGEGAEELDAKNLHDLSPETILRLDALIDGLTGGGMTNDALKAIRAALVRPTG